MPLSEYECTLRDMKRLKTNKTVEAETLLTNFKCVNFVEKQTNKQIRITFFEIVTFTFFVLLILARYSQRLLLEKESPKGNVSFS